MSHASDWIHQMSEAVNHANDEYWSLVGKLSITLGIPISVPILIAMFWLGQLSSQVQSVDHQQQDMIRALSGLITFSSQETERSASNTHEIQRLRDEVEDLIKQTAKK